ncbi:MAG TPA: hypothetical protein VJJ22_00540 [Candidatus Paceibacterota bacterium]
MGKIQPAEKALKKDAEYQKRLLTWPIVYEDDLRKVFTEVPLKAYADAVEDSQYCDKCGVYYVDLDVTDDIVNEIADKLKKALKKKSTPGHKHK